MGHYSSFILRLWVEPDEGWRWGLIEHVASREKLRFSSSEEMLAFIQSHSDVNEQSIPFVLAHDDSSPALPDDGEKVTHLPVARRHKRHETKPKKVNEAPGR